ncbi:LuxR family transcriptional regulator [Microbacterium sp. C7(2022)]|uniref:LuxR family transcriptional regulator n=1 Tax=Microbacterium sp. C7(2022) TaxID=2992759 RepID=UPI00237B6E9F|nr:LuxR family transcriptional regulator [Microbacterium sp. C7(2022)]MDE0546141.1 AAA family ATPase [Microbacterium sp. C7(2022)]
MTDTLRQTGRGEPDLLTAPLSAGNDTPPVRESAVSRRATIDVARTSAARVVSVVAPAGYGKSTLLAEWAATETRAVGWATLDRTDADPAALLSEIAAASVSFSPDAATVMADMRGVGTAALGRSAPLLARALAAAPQSFVLFVDDLHWASSLDCEDALEVLVARVPVGSQIVLASRHVPSVIGRLRACGDVHEVSADELRVDAAGARAIFAQAGATGASDSELVEIVERCEGWPAGVYLCALVARSGGDAAAITGDDRFVADFLYRECVARLPEDTQAFLRRSAVLDRMSAASCNAVLGIEDARSRLFDLEAANLFLISVDRRRGSYRYHSLFHEFLLTELERSEGASAVADLHRRAAEWHDEHGDGEQVVEHLLRAGDTERAAARVAEISLPMYGSGHVATVCRWLDELGDDLVRRHPALVISMTWITVLLGETAAGERWARSLDGVDAAGMPASERAEFESARAMVRAAMGRGGHRQVLADAAYAMAHEPATSPWRDQALHLWGSSLLLAGDAAKAEPIFEEAIDMATIMGNADTVILSAPELALFAMAQGRWGAAREHVEQAVTMVDDSHMEGYPTTTLALAVAARVALHDGDRDHAMRLLARGMRARVGCTHVMPWVSVRARLQLAKAHIALGERGAAWHLMKEIDELLRKRPDVGALNGEVEKLRASMTDEPAGEGSVPLTPAELRLLPYLQTHLTIAEIGQRLFISRNTVSSELGSIYRKLAVTTRGAAVERAVALGMLGG